MENKSMTQNIDNLNTRLASVEADVRHLSKAQEELSHQLTAGFEILTTKIESLGNKGQITWPLIFTCIGTLVAVFGIGGVIHTITLTPIHVEISNLHKEIDSHMSEEGHIATLSKQIGIQKDIFRIDADIDALHKLLATEITSSNELSEAKREAMKERLDLYYLKIRDLQERMLSIESSRYTAADAKEHQRLTVEQHERISALEALVKELMK